MLNKLFYVIYNSYYKHGEYKNDNPPLTVGGIFAVFFFSVGNSIHTIFQLMNDPLIRHLPKLSKPLILLILSCCGLLVYFTFYYNKRYVEIYELYKNNFFLNNKKTKYFAFSFIIIVILSPLLIGLIRNKIYFGHWV